MPLHLNAEHFTPLLLFVSVNFLLVCSNHDLGGWRDDDLMRGDLNDNSIDFNYFVESKCNTSQWPSAPENGSSASLCPLSVFLMTNLFSIALQSIIVSSPWTAAC